MILSLARIIESSFIESSFAAPDGKLCGLTSKGEIRGIALPES
jgi:hypothetical protein